ncbi:MAG: 50S ribosomal protein L10 [Candidatus Marsarchaeota archaeon]|jgi:large subunit ribosomal protein L10|nr:50S ribosomal protein L10 [Candidatus Marsarchaeota archaeon]MCL5434224.1 50S ribosomal protein L10 [Candidatus Marsarchaeota archaeon]
MLSLNDKKKFVENGAAELKKYSSVGVVNLSGVPDRLLQSSRNKMRSSTTFIIGRKKMLEKILESREDTKELAKYMSGTSAIVLSNEDPFELYGRFKENEIKLAAKPRQVAPSDIVIESGETSLQPGQAVTELKAAGIDVKIDKGKVVISKSKTIVEKGGIISQNLAKALHTLDILPFTASIVPKAIKSGKILFTDEVLGITKEGTLSDLTRAFAQAFALSSEAGIVNQYTIVPMIEKAFDEAIALGVDIKAPDSGIVELLLGEGYAGAAALNAVQGS